MKKRRICLFTAHAPTVGGGGAILRSLIANLPEIDIQWCYLNPKPVPGYEDGWLGAALMGGPMLKDILQTGKMLMMGNVAIINGIVEKLLAKDCHGYWIVSHNEGLRIAIDLKLKQQTRPVHMTVHDDWAGALSARSVRYRLMKIPALRLTKKALQTVPSFDVISYGMQDYYQQLSGIKGEVCHRYLPAKSLLSSPNPDDETDEVTIGHIGSIYEKTDLFNFLELLIAYYQPKGKKVLLKMWGCHLTWSDVPANLQQHINFFDTLPEDKVIPQLAECRFVYCMYPLNKALHMFSKTSLPTKLSSYLQAGRPIFGHGPADSTLAEFLSATGLGALWSTENKQDGFDQLEIVSHAVIEPQEWEQARQRYFGEKNLEVMCKALVPDYQTVKPA